MYLPPVLSGNMISISSFFAPFFTILGQGAIIHCRAIVIVLNIALLCLFHLIVNNNNVIFFFHLNNNNFIIPPDVSVASITPEEKQLSLDSVSPHLSWENTHIITERPTQTQNTCQLGKHKHVHVHQQSQDIEHYNTLFLLWFSHQVENKQTLKTKLNKPVQGCDWICSFPFSLVDFPPLVNLMPNCRPTRLFLARFANSRNPTR